MPFIPLKEKYNKTHDKKISTRLNIDIYQASISGHTAFLKLTVAIHGVGQLEMSSTELRIFFTHTHTKKSFFIGNSVIYCQITGPFP